jgi:hypothetical protein
MSGATLLVAFLWLTAIATAAAGLAGLMPRKLVARRLPVQHLDETGWFFLRHWAVLVLLCGGLLGWAALNDSARPALMTLVAAEKLAFSFLVFRSGNSPLGRVLRGGAIAELLAAVVLLAAAWL